MKASTKQQIRNGIRVGGSLGLFLIAVMILGVALDGLRAGAPNQLRLWPDGAIAAGLITLAAVLMVLTARVWILYIAGCLLFAIPKCLVMIASGRSFYSPHESFSRLYAAEFALFSVVSLFLLYRVVQNKTPAVIDRLAFTLFTFCFVFGLSQHGVALVAIWQILGLAALCFGWFLTQKRHRKHGARAEPTVSGSSF